MSRMKSDTIAHNQVMNYRTFENLQFKRLLKNSFHTVQIDIRDATGEQIPFMALGITRLTLVFRKLHL